MIGALIFGIVLFWLQLSPLEAVIGALIGVVTHWGLEILHHLGHAWAAPADRLPDDRYSTWHIGDFRHVTLSIR